MDKWLIIPILIGIGLGQLVRWPILGWSAPVLDVIVGVVVVVGLWSVVKSRASMPPRFLLLAWGVLMAVFALSWLVNLSTLGGSNGLSALLFLIRFIVYGALPFALWPHLLPTRVEFYQQWLLVLFVLVAALGWLQLGLFPDLRMFEYLGFDPHLNRLVSTFLDPNLVGIFLAFGAGLAMLATKHALHWRVKLLHTIITLFLIASVMATFSRSALLALVVILLIIGWMNYRRAIWVGLALVAMAFLLVPRLQDRLTGVWDLDVTARHRLESWHNGWQIVRARPWLGVGYNAVATERYRYASPGTEPLAKRAKSAFDSSLLTIWASAGTLGLVTFLSWVAIVLGMTWHSWREPKKVFGSWLWAITVGLLGAALFVNAWLTTPLLIVWWITIGLSWKEQS